MENENRKSSEKQQLFKLGKNEAHCQGSRELLCARLRASTRIVDDEPESPRARFYNNKSSFAWHLLSAPFGPSDASAARRA